MDVMTNSEWVVLALAVMVVVFLMALGAFGITAVADLVRIGIPILGPMPFGPI